MASLSELRDRHRDARLQELERGVREVHAGRPALEVWLYSFGEAFGFGSWARRLGQSL